MRFRLDELDFGGHHQARRVPVESHRQYGLHADIGYKVEVPGTAAVVAVIWLASQPEGDTMRF